MIEIIKVENESQLQLFAGFKVKLMAEIREVALKLEIQDKQLQNYNIHRALKSAEIRNNFLIMYEGKYIGNFQISMCEALCETKQVIYLHNIYMEKDYRSLGIGRSVIDFIRAFYKRPIECECWYEMSSLLFFNSLGFKRVRISLYSDQNCISENK